MKKRNTAVRLLIVILTVILSLSLAGCELFGKKTDSSDVPDPDGEQTITDGEGNNGGGEDKVPDSGEDDDPGSDAPAPGKEDPPRPGPVEYTLTYTASEGGKISGTAEQTVENGKDGGEVTAVPNAGYVFLGWSDKSAQPAVRKDTAVTSDLAVEAVFVPEQFTVTYAANNYSASDLSAPAVKKAKHDSSVTVTVTPRLGHKFVEWSDGVTTATRSDDAWRHGETITAIFAPDALNLPIVNIDTLGNAPPTVKNDIYVPCTVGLGNAESKYCFEDKTAGIRVRGNTTARYTKKPYRIKFDKKISILGSENKYKSWCLLALYQDFSGVKDYTAFKIARDIGTGNFVPSANHVEVYMNGEYMGLYLLTDNVDEKEGRLGVEVPAINPAAAEIPFFAEIDDYAQNEGTENVNWFRINVTEFNVTYFVELKYPEVKDGATAAQFAYFKNYIMQVHNMIFDPDVTKAQFEALVDLPSFIDYYLVQEVMGQAEINNKSIKMSKSSTGKLVMGPVWDFDWAVGGPMRVGSGMNTSGAYDVNNWQSQSNWFARLIGSRSGTAAVPWFKAEVKARWEQIKPVILSSLNEVAAYKSALTPVAVRNAELWTKLHKFESVSSSGAVTYPAVNTDFDRYYNWVLDYVRTKANSISKLLA